MFVYIAFVIVFRVVFAWGPFNMKKNPIIYKEFDSGSPTYTIISDMQKKTKNLIEELENNKMNFIHIDKSLYAQYELIEILDYYSAGRKKEVPDIMVFLEDKKYIGGAFELYEEIFRAD
jgi:hypothetical protein